LDQGRLLDTLYDNKPADYSEAYECMCEARLQFLTACGNPEGSPSPRKTAA
jgi:hypothetical protein